MHEKITYTINILPGEDGSGVGGPTHTVIVAPQSLGRATGAVTMAGVVVVSSGTIVFIHRSSSSGGGRGG